MITYIEMLKMLYYPLKMTDSQQKTISDTCGSYFKLAIEIKSQ